jgi:hypothetical protein
MLLMTTGTWIVIGVAIAIVAVFVGTKVKNRYY